MPFPLYHFFPTPTFGERRSRETGSFYLHCNYERHNPVRLTTALCLQLTMGYYIKSIYVYMEAWEEEGHRWNWGILILTKVQKISAITVSCCELATVCGYLPFSSLSEIILSIPTLKQGLPFSLRNCSYRLRL